MLSSVCVKRASSGFLSCLVGLWLLAAWAVAGENWPQFRGPGASGVSDGSGLPDRWSATENVVWKTKIPGRAWSSPIVWGDRIFVTSAIQEEGELEAVKPGLYIGGERKPEGKMHRWIVYCLDWNTGKIVWEKTAGRQVPKYSHHLKNSMASETPATDGQRLYAYFGYLGLFCYDFDGKPLWSRSWGDYGTRMNWGTGASPVVHGNRVYVVNDNEEKSFLAAVDAKTGEQVSRVPRDEKSNWATPLVWQNEKRTELVTGGSNASGPTTSTASCSGSWAGCRRSTSPPRPRRRHALSQLRLRGRPEEASAGSPARGVGRHLAEGRGRERGSLWKIGRSRSQATSMWRGARNRRGHTTRRRSSMATTCTSSTTAGSWAVSTRGPARKSTPKPGSTLRPCFHRVAVGLRKEALLPERRRRHLRDSGRAGVQAPSQQQPGRAVHGDAGHRPPQPDRSHGVPVAPD